MTRMNVSRETFISRSGNHIGRPCAIAPIKTILACQIIDVAMIKIPENPIENMAYDGERFGDDWNIVRTQTGGFIASAQSAFDSGKIKRSLETLAAGSFFYMTHIADS